MRNALAVLLLAAWTHPGAAEESPLLIVDSVPQPGQTLSYLIGRPQSVQALRAARRSEGLVFVMHGDMGASPTAPGSAAATGTLCRIVSLEETPVGVNTRLEGLSVARASSLPLRDGMLYAEFPPQGRPIPNRSLPLPGRGLSGPGPHPQPVSAAAVASYPGNPAPGLLREPPPRDGTSAGDLIDVDHGNPVSEPSSGGASGPLRDSEASARPSDPPLFLIGVFTLSALVAAASWVLGARKKSAQARRVTLLSRLHSGIPGDPGRSWKAFMEYLGNDGDPEALSAEELHALLSAQKGPLLKLRVSDSKAVAVAGLFSKDGRDEEAFAILAARIRSILCGPQADQLLAFDIYERGGRAQDFILKARAGAGPRARHALLGILNKRGKPELAYSLLRSDGAQDDPGLLLEIADSFSKVNKIQAALDLLKDPVLIHAARTPGGCDKALDILERALKLKEFTASAAGKPPEFLSAFARAFERRGMPEKALALLQASAARDAEDQAFTAELLVSLGRPDEALVTLARRPRREWSDAAYLLCFRLHIDLGEVEKAKELYGPVRIRKPPRDAPDLYYAFGLLCERSAQSDLAADVYARLAEPPISHEKAAQRLHLLRSPLAAPRPAAQPPGLLGGKYELRASLADGGMGKVYEGHDHALGRKVAVKKLHTELKSSPKERERFLQEARIVAGLSHPFIVGVHEIVEADGEVYLVFDFIDGRSLSALLEERGRLPLEECRSILKQVCLAVDFAHKKKVLHRDLKPSNIMVGKDGFARVLDFGLARTAKDSVSKLTRRGLSGTLAYLAPEQHLGSSHRASDIYALGVTLYEMLTGELPFQGPDLLKLKEAGLFVPLSAKDPSLPQSLDALMAAALEPDHTKRLYRSIEFLQRLNS